MTDLDDRLDAYHQRLVGEFASDAARLVAAAATAPPRRRVRQRVWAAAAVVVAVSAGLLTARMVPNGTPASITVKAPGLTIVAAADRHVTARLTASQAEAVAFASLTAHGAPQITGYTLTTARFIPDVQRISQQCGAHIAIPARHDVWVVAYTAPPQGRWQFVRAAMVVDDANGELLGGQILEGPKASGPLATCHWGT